MWVKAHWKYSVVRQIKIWNSFWKTSKRCPKKGGGPVCTSDKRTISVERYVQVGLKIHTLCVLFSLTQWVELIFVSVAYVLSFSIGHMSHSAKKNWQWSKQWSTHHWSWYCGCILLLHAVDSSAFWSNEKSVVLPHWLSIDRSEYLLEKYLGNASSHFSNAHLATTDIQLSIICSFTSCYCFPDIVLWVLPS